MPMRMDSSLKRRKVQDTLPEDYIALREKLRIVLESELNRLQAGSRLEELRHHEGEDLRPNAEPPLETEAGEVTLVERPVTIVQATVHSPELFTADEVSVMEQALGQAVAGPVWLQIDNYERAFIDSTGYSLEFSSGKSSD